MSRKRGRRTGPKADEAPDGTSAPVPGDEGRARSKPKIGKALKERPVDRPSLEAVGAEPARVDPSATSRSAGPLPSAADALMQAGLDGAMTAFAATLDGWRLALDISDQFLASWGAVSRPTTGTTPRDADRRA